MSKLAIINAVPNASPVRYGLNGVFGEVACNTPVTLTDALYQALLDANEPIEKYYTLGAATGAIILDGTGTRRAVMVNGVLVQFPVGEAFTPTTPQLEAIDHSGLTYSLEYDLADDLAALTLDADTIAHTAIVGDDVGNVVGKTAGSTLELTDDAGGKYSLTGLLVEAAGALAAGTDHITITETLDGRTSSPKATVLAITVT